MGDGATTTTTGTKTTEGTAAGGEATTEMKGAPNDGALTGDEGGEESLLAGGDEGAGKGDGKAEEGKGQGDAGKPDAAADVELKLPEGFESDEALVGEFKGVAKELGLDSAKAQKVFDLYAKAQDTLIKEIVAGHEAERAEEQQAWVKEIRSDKEFGGEKFDASVRAARAAVEKFAPELRPWLKETGLTNHPGLFRLFARIGLADTEDSSAGARGGAGAGREKIETYEDLGRALGYAD